MIEKLLEYEDGDITPPLPDELGPGPTELMGSPHIGLYGDVGNPDYVAGFFGETPVSQLISGDSLATLVGFTVGLAQNPTAPWLKFILDDVVIYIPKLTYRYYVSWTQLQARNVVDHSHIVEIQGYRFSIGLLGGLNLTPSVPFAAGYDNEPTWNSEWNRLMYPICEQPSYPAYAKNSQIGENWVSYTEAELGITVGDGRYNWCRETPNHNATHRVLRGVNAVTYLSSDTSSFNANTNRGWRPMLRLLGKV